MRILHLSRDWKWTGPAAPMLTLALAQRERGDEVGIVCPEPPAGASDSLADRARAAGLPPVHPLPRGRAIQVWRDWGHVRRVRSLLRERSVDVVHVWHTRDHLLALRAALGRRGSGRLALVRTLASADPKPAPWERWLLGPGTDGLWCISPGAARAHAPLRGGRPIAGGFGAVSLERFRPQPPDPRVREALGLKAEHRVVAVVARAQPRRRFDLLLAAMAHLARDDPYARLLVIGRGTRGEEIVTAPAARLGIADRVVCAGYRADDYADVLRAADVATLLVPGSDGTCRALLEAAACGIPAVVTPRGPLTEIVVDGETGRVVPEEAGVLARALGRLLSDRALRARLGAAARARAEEEFSPSGLATRVDTLYREACR